MAFPADNEHVVGWRDAALGIVLFVVFLAGSLGAVWWAAWPWEALVVLLPLGAAVVWRLVARLPFAALGFRRHVRWRHHLIAPVVVAAGYGAGSLVIAHWAGVRTLAGTPSSVVVGVGTVVVLAPLVAVMFTAIPEEFVFRGFYLRAFAPHTGLLLAAVVSSVLFALAHLPNLLADGGLPLAVLSLRLLTLFGFGLLMAWAAVRTGALWFPMAWHAGGNYAAVVAEMLAGSQRDASVGSELLAIALLAGEAGVVAVLLARVSRDDHPVGFRAPDGAPGATNRRR